jgi:hypothetical protein
LDAKWAGKKASSPEDYFSSFALRAVNVLVNDAARHQGIQLHKNFRVPERSVIHTVFAQSLAEGASVEDLDWWESSDGTRLEKCEIRVFAKKIGDTIHALLIPR